MYIIEVNAWCDVFSGFVAVGTFVSVGAVCSGIFAYRLYVLMCAVCIIG